MKKRLFFLLNITLVLSLIMPSPAAAEENQVGLQPGEIVTFEQEVPVHIVFLGYDQATINRQAFRDLLPTTYVPIVRVAPYYYGLPGRDLGLKFHFDYEVTFTDNEFEDRFFNYLKEIGTPGDPTDFQLMYNDQKKNVLEVTGPVLYIDAPSVEAWLASEFQREKGYTVVFINWYSRPDFNFHVYTKVDEPDPDTDFNFGELRASRKIIAWGGTHSRLWFYDLSAGPEARTSNWNVDERDLDGNGVEDYRMPPIWEYTKGGYRKPSALSTDLGKVTRYVAINLLFTSSPLYDPLVAAPGPDGRRVVHINMLEDDPKNLGTDWFNTSFALEQFTAFQPYYDWEVNLVDVNPIDEQARRAFRIFSEVRKQDDCWNEFGTPFAELFCFFNQNYSQYVPEYGPADYVLAMFAFNTTDARMGVNEGLLGFADDNWTDGTQTFVFAFDTPGSREAGFGFTTTIVHEGGHHVGMSHPFDGYDSEQGLDYGPADEFYFAWSGDESHTVMQYIALANGFGQFDRDNMYRWETAGYLNWSNALLAEILAHPDANLVQERVATAESLAQAAIVNFEEWRYLEAVTNARETYEQIALAAAELGIGPVADQAMLQLAPMQVLWHKGDSIR